MASTAKENGRSTHIAQRFCSPPMHDLTEEEVSLVEDERFEPARG
jgi:hypothetical protein